MTITLDLQAGAEVAACWEQIGLTGTRADREKDMADGAAWVRRQRDRSSQRARDGKAGVAMRLSDTEVVVDAVRGYLPALHWLASQTEQPGLPGIVMMELAQGCVNKAELRRVEIAAVSGLLAEQPYART